MRLLLLTIMCIPSILMAQAQYTGKVPLKRLDFYDGTYQVTAATVYSTQTYYADGVSILKTGTTFYANPSSVTLQGNAYSLAELSRSTYTLSLATVSLQNQINSLSISTQALRTEITNLSASTTSLQQQLGTLSTTYVNVSGDVMTGTLTVVGIILADGTTVAVKTDIVNPSTSTIIQSYSTTQNSCLSLVPNSTMTIRTYYPSKFFISVNGQLSNNINTTWEATVIIDGSYASGSSNTIGLIGTEVTASKTSTIALNHMSLRVFEPGVHTVSLCIWTTAGTVSTPTSRALNLGIQAWRQ